MKRKQSPFLIILLVVAVLFSLFLYNLKADPARAPERISTALENKTQPTITKNGAYTKKEDVALYVLTYETLPGNFITKNQARDLGWEGGDLRPYAADKAIGGDRFMNFEGLLPRRKGRVYYEADIDTLGKPSRGTKRLVFSNDGLIYYSDDHYKTFTLLYGEE